MWLTDGPQVIRSWAEPQNRRIIYVVQYSVAIGMNDPQYGHSLREFSLEVTELLMVDPRRSDSFAVYGGVK